MKLLSFRFIGLLLIMIPCLTTKAQHTYYVATDGSNQNTGSYQNPLADINKAVSLAIPGDTIFLRGGVYNMVSPVSIVKNGAPNNYLYLWNYKSERVILDFSEITPTDLFIGVYLNGNYWHIKGLEIRGCKQKVGSSSNLTLTFGFYATNSNYNILENFDIHDNQGIGLGISNISTGNLILNGDFHHNYDPYTYSSNGNPDFGGNADGIHVGEMPSTSVNSIVGCRTWWNSDDGIDNYMNEGIVNIENCWSFYNGFIPDTFEPIGDGNGFKMGNTNGPATETPVRVFKNCVAFGNYAHGFDQNDLNGKMAFYNNTSYKNGSYGFYIGKYNLKNIVKNNIALSNNLSTNFVEKEIQISAESDVSNNSWNFSNVTDSEFLSVDPNGIDNPRNSDHSLPNLNFLKLKPYGEKLIDTGIDVNLPYTGDAPDIGAFEFKQCP